MLQPSIVPAHPRVVPRTATQPRRAALASMLALAVALCCQPVLAGDMAEAFNPYVPVPVKTGVTLFNNVRIFDGTHLALSAPSNVLVRGNTIAQISTASINVASGPGVTVVQGNGRTLMPGLIDAHWHSFMAGVPAIVVATSPADYVHYVAGAMATRTLMQGFTTVRDLGGPVFGLKRAIDDGTIVGPRIYPSGAMISQTAGHGDFRTPNELPRQLGGPLSHSELEGLGAIADSPDEVRMRTREQLRLGASQIKLTAGGGVNSPHGDIDSVQFTQAEIHAAVEAAEQWGGTYVTVHAYTPAAIRNAIAAGVKAIDHGQLADDATAKLMADKGIWWSLQPLVDSDDMAPMDPAMRQRALQVFAGTDSAYRLARKYKVKTAFGADILFSPDAAAHRHAAPLVLLLRWYSAGEALKMATGDNGEFMALSGRINPYPGRLGVVQEGALADLLLVEGNPLENLKLIEDPEKNLVVIMKDGEVFKNLEAAR